MEKLNIEAFRGLTGQQILDRLDPLVDTNAVLSVATVAGIIHNLINTDNPHNHPPSAYPAAEVRFNRRNEGYPWP